MEGLDSAEAAAAWRGQGERIRQPKRAADAGREEQVVAKVDVRAVFDDLPAMVGNWGADLRNILANRTYVEFLGPTPGRCAAGTSAMSLGSSSMGANLPSANVRRSRMSRGAAARGLWRPRSSRSWKAT